MQTRVLARNALIGFLACCTVGAVSCDDEEVAPCDLWTATAIVSGIVREGSFNAPIVNTEVQVRIGETDQCTEPWQFELSVFTDDQGRFSETFELGNQNGFRCVSATEVNSGTTVQDQVEFVGGCEETRPPGQVNLEITVGAP